MKKYTHAWLAFKAIERLASVTLSDANRKYADSLITWFSNHKDGVIEGAWYPDQVIKDNASSHVLKIKPATSGEAVFLPLPSKMLIYESGKSSPLFDQPYEVDKDDNLPNRCEALAHSVIDNLKVQRTEDKGSPVSPTGNQVALVLFMLSHYVADAHMPFHCDSRRFSDGINLHSVIEGEWEEEVKQHYDIDYQNERFFYTPQGYPHLTGNAGYGNSFLKSVDEDAKTRSFLITYGQNNKNVLGYMSTLCRYSYLLSYSFIPQGYDETNVTLQNWQSLPGQNLTFQQLSVMVLADAVDSIARIWLRVWRRYEKWLAG
jgi:hypothetical protein